MSRVLVDLLGAVPAEGDLWVRSRIDRSGRQIELVSAEMLAPGPDGEPRPVARASGWRLKTIDTREVVHAPAPPLRPLAEAKSRDMKKDWDRNYVHSLDWRWLTEPLSEGPGESWIRPEVDLVSGESMTPLERLFAVADDANGIGTRLDIRRWTFMNTDLVVHVHRIPEANGSASAPKPATAPTVLARRWARCSTSPVPSARSSSRSSSAPCPAAEFLAKWHSSRPSLELWLLECHFAATGLLDEPQSGRGALGDGLLYPLAVGLRPLDAVDLHDAVLCHLEHVLGDRFADAVPGALVEIDFDAHQPSLSNDRGKQRRQRLVPGEPLAGAQQREALISLCERPAPEAVGRDVDRAELTSGYHRFSVTLREKFVKL